jgi:hypothetical protein
MLTIFSVPKPFCGHIGVIQRNAIRSWTYLHPECEIVLCGDEFGTAEIAGELKVKHISEITCNEYGTPLLDSVFNNVGQIAGHRLMCYVNSDIILLSDFLEAIQRIQLQDFVMVGRRWDVDLTKPWNFEATDWEGQLNQYVMHRGVLHKPIGSDYFVFPRNKNLEALPPFAVGRPGWDNWFIYNAQMCGISVIDVTQVTTVIHQNHDHNHVPHRKANTKWQGPEADQNYALIKSRDRIFTLRNVSHVMTSDALLPVLEHNRPSKLQQSLPISARALKFVRRFVKSIKRSL